MLHIPGYEPSRTDRLMLAFTIPPLVLVTGLGFVTRALANWAAPAFVSAVIVVIAIMLRRGQWKWIMVSLGFGVVAQVALLAGDVMATRVHVPFISDGDVYHRTLAGGHSANAPASSPGAAARAPLSARRATTRPPWSITGATSQSRFSPGSAGGCPIINSNSPARSRMRRRSR